MHTNFVFEEPNNPKPSIKHHFTTFIAFIVTLFALPIFIFCYYGARISKKIWMQVLSNRFPHLEFVEKTTIKTLLDSQKNQGVLNILMSIKGSCQPLQVRQALMETIVEKKDRIGRYKYPKLRAGLVSCWGCYAWKTPFPFNIENHLTLGNPTFRGRLISDHNIQDYVSDIVSKYLPSNIPPWQITIIPNVASNQEKYFILIRVHHLLVADDEPLNIGDFFLLKNEEQDSYSECASPFSIESQTSTNAIKSPLTDIIKLPEALPKLFNLLSDTLSNKWNEFISKYDPIESPKTVKLGPGIFHCLAILLIVFVKTVKDLEKITTANKNDDVGNVRLFLLVFQSEIMRRNITTTMLLKSILITFGFKNCIVNFFRISSSIIFMFWIRLPKFLYCEFLALLTLKKYSSNPNTIVAYLYNNTPLLYTAGKELVYLAKVIYTAPISVLNEIVFCEDNPEPHQLQTESLCGRKVIAWSKPVSRKTIGHIAAAAGVTETEILLVMTKNCIKNYFQDSGLKVPKTVLLTARSVMCDIYLTSIKKQHKESDDGLVCISLPIDNMDENNIIDEVHSIHKEIKRVRQNQGAVFTIGKNQTFIVETLPSVVARIILNFWTRKFSILLTEIVDNSDGSLRETRWGHTVLSFLCWKPPQANICMSLTLQRYAGTIRIGVMTDSRIYPQHVNATHGWKETAQELQNYLESSHNIYKK